MRKSISVITKDKYLFQKIFLELCGEYDVIPYPSEESVKTLVDLDSADEKGGGAVTMSRYGRADLSLPFPIGSLSSFLRGGEEKIFSLDSKRHSAYLRGEEIRLTEVEFALLSVIYGAGGEFISREEILERVWKNSADSGVINVYVHYLREKLERHGEKIILSSRKGGYRIDEKYLGGEIC